jgi:hypothetical protein
MTPKPGFFAVPPGDSDRWQRRGSRSKKGEQQFAKKCMDELSSTGVALQGFMIAETVAQLEAKMASGRISLIRMHQTHHQNQTNALVAAAKGTNKYEKAGGKFERVRKNNGGDSEHKRRLPSPLSLSPRRHSEKGARMLSMIGKRTGGRVEEGFFKRCDTGGAYRSGSRSGSRLMARVKAAAKVAGAASKMSGLAAEARVRDSMLKHHNTSRRHTRYFTKSMVELQETPEQHYARCRHTWAQQTATKSRAAFIGPAGPLADYRKRMARFHSEHASGVYGVTVDGAKRLLQGGSATGSALLSKRAPPAGRPQEMQPNIGRGSVGNPQEMNPQGGGEGRGSGQHNGEEVGVDGPVAFSQTSSESARPRRPIWRLFSSIDGGKDLLDTILQARWGAKRAELEVGCQAC